jgi:hypothetical protein
MTAAAIDNHLTRVTRHYFKTLDVQDAAAYAGILELAVEYGSTTAETIAAVLYLAHRPSASADLFAALVTTAGAMAIGWGDERQIAEFRGSLPDFPPASS